MPKKVDIFIICLYQGNYKKHKYVLVPYNILQNCNNHPVNNKFVIKVGDIQFFNSFFQNSDYYVNQLNY